MGLTGLSRPHVRLPLPPRPAGMGLQPATLGCSASTSRTCGGLLAGHMTAAAAQQQRRRRRPQQQRLGTTASALCGSPMRPLGLPALPQRRRRLWQAPPPAPTMPGIAPGTLDRRRTVLARSGVYAVDPLAALGTDFLTFLVATVLVVPVFKSAKQSPVLGYLFAGLVLGQLGLFRNLEEVEKLAELGVLFLLFEMGLELSIDRLRSLANYAFGMGTLQMVLCTLAFTVLGLPPGQSFFSQFLENVLHVPPELANLRTVDEAVVIGAALSLSSSAFVLQLLRERGELDKRFGQATLGILLLQDIATVPFLVLLPLIEGSNSTLLEGQDTMLLLLQLAPTVLKTVGGLAVVLLGGRLFMRRVFELVAEAKSEETFIALCLLTVTGASLLTQRMGFSDTLGAFVAGVLLSETNFKAQVEADIQPFRGILLGLFFVTTGSSLDVGLLVQQWPLVLTLLVGLLSLKIGIISALGPRFGLTQPESIRTGFVLSQGGEFAFVLLALANQLNVLPAELNRLLIIVVVLSMALTPLLTEVGKQVADYMTAQDGDASMLSSEGYKLEEPVLICGFGDVGQTVANMLDSPALGRSVPYVAFDQSVGRVQAAQEAGFNVLYGDGSRAKVLHAAGIERPKAIAVSYTARQRAVNAVEGLREAFPDVPIYVRALDMRHAAALQEAGADYVVTAATEAGLTVGGKLARGLGVPGRAITGLTEVLRTAMDARSAELAEELSKASTSGGANGGGKDDTAVLIFKFDQSKSPAFLDDAITPDPVPLIDDGSGGAPPRGSLLATIIAKLEAVSGSTQDMEDESYTPIGMAPNAAAEAAVAAARAAQAGVAAGNGGGSGALNVQGTLDSVDLSGDEEGPDGSELVPVAWQDGTGSSGDYDSDEEAPSAEKQVAAVAVAAAAKAAPQQ